MQFLLNFDLNVINKNALYTQKKIKISYNQYFKKNGFYFSNHLFNII